MNPLNSRPILCGTDFSQPAQQAANVAAALAIRLGVPLVLAHGLDERGDFPPYLWPSFAETARPQLREEAERLRKLGAEVEEKLLGGVPDDGVVKCAEQKDAQLIVLASSGMGALGRWMIGSVSEEISATAWVPTLVVRDAAVFEAWLRGERPLKVFVGADFTATSDAALRWVEELATIAPCEVTVGYIDRHADERGAQAVQETHLPRASAIKEMLIHYLREKACALYDGERVHIHVLSATDQVDACLTKLAGETNADLIVVGTNQWHGLSRLNNRSVSRRVLHQAQASVACVPARTLAHGASEQIPKVSRMLAATDLSTHGGHAVPHAYSMLESGDSVCLVHVVPPGTPNEPILERLRSLIPDEAAHRGIRSEVRVIENADVPAGICDAAERFRADRLCLGSRGHSGLLAGVIGSVAHAVIARSRRPVLVVCAPAP